MNSDSYESLTIPRKSSRELCFQQRIVYLLLKLFQLVSNLKIMEEHRQNRSAHLQ